MGYTVFSKNLMLDALRTGITEISLHTADPGAAGTDEVAGGGYARATVTGASFVAASGGEVLLDGDQAFVGPANTGCSYFGLWAGSNFVGGGPITGDITFNAEGDFTLKAATKFDLNAV